MRERERGWGIEIITDLCRLGPEAGVASHIPHRQVVARAGIRAVTVIEAFQSATLVKSAIPVGRIVGIGVGTETAQTGIYDLGSLALRTAWPVLDPL